MTTHAQMHLAVRILCVIDLPAEMLECKCSPGATPCIRKLQHQSVTQTFDNAPAMQRQNLLFTLLHQFLPAHYKVIRVQLHEPYRLDHVHHQQHFGVAVQAG